MQRPPNPSGQPDPGYERIKAALEAILATDKFLAAPQMSAFLRYVVEQTASGNQSRIKAYTVAVDALGKPENFDPQNDPVVRVLAGRLRATLAAYYEINPTAEVVIEMRPGSYVPNFVMRASAKDAESQSGSTAVAIPDEDPSQAPGETNGLPSDEVIEASQAANHQWASASLPAQSGPSEYSQSSRHQRHQRHQRRQGDSTAGKSRDGRAQSDNIGILTRLPWRSPKLVTAAAALIIAVFAGLVLNEPDSGEEPAMQAGSPVSVNSAMSAPARQRPDSLTLFVSALEPVDSLASQINTMLSGVFSEADNVRVYRLLKSTQVQQYWPEDYLVSLDVLALPEETRVSVQLVNAQTGQVNHSHVIHLSAQAAQGLTHSELKEIMDFARYLISEDGPLVKDYQTKLDQ